MIVLSGFVCSWHKIACKKKNNTFVTVNNDFLSLVRRFGNDFHSWLRHSWKSLPNRLTSDKKSLFTVTNALFFISIYHTSLYYDHGRCQDSSNEGNQQLLSWWRHQMETFSALLALSAGNSPVTGEFPSRRPVTRSFDVFFDLRLNKRLSESSRRWLFETPSRPLWCHCNVVV